ncbi:hypothetical protein [Marilutibacter alkalisoli]|uniref:Lytic transglycosylase domain-containing protein n=1 Tax=Marilutibacter alkalisoli TaxID=2591633 RepID=A0A514BTX9_9GAMM|nr:hypothetical protein [Lysobacter alkalisoli]QDH70853.1 hypothetical protein FKV23_12740 [Lysobacter alkalisoli]
MAGATVLPLPITPSAAVCQIIRPALALLPQKMDSAKAVGLILTIMLQEVGRDDMLAYRWQVVDLKRPEVKGPARGLAQFERGTYASRGGVWGIYLHPASRPHLQRACNTLRVPFDALKIWQALASNDALSVVCARLLLWTDAAPLPALGDEAGGWDYYLRNWRPGAYTRGTSTKRASLRAKWSRNYRTAMTTLDRGSR